ncbi:MAG: ester cyclase [Candidatus Thorarchaeota archaeon]
MTNRNKDIVKEFIDEVWNKGNVEAIDKFIDPEYVGHDHDSGHIVNGLKGVKMSMISVRAAFPDISITIDDIFGEGDKVVMRFTMVGTPCEEYSPDEKCDQKKLKEIIIYRLTQGKIVEAWSIGTPFK